MELYFEVVPQMEKQTHLDQILRCREQGSKVIVFCSTESLCDQVADTIGAAAIHGDKSQHERDLVLHEFCCGKSPILLAATDDAACQIDIKDIRVVINYDFPNVVEDYVYQVERIGVLYTSFSEHDWKYAANLIQVLERAKHLMPLGYVSHFVVFR